jgi:hypothetical protein
LLGGLAKKTRGKRQEPCLRRVTHSFVTVRSD